MVPERYSKSVFRFRRPKNYIICASHRSGSTLLCEGLRYTWKCGNPREYLSPTRSVVIHERGEIEADPREDFPAYVAEVFQKKRQANGIFGMKVMWSHVRYFPRRMGLKIDKQDHRRLARAMRRHFGPVVFIWSRREDKVRQAVSMVKAKHTRQYSHKKEPIPVPAGPLPSFDFDEVDEQVQRFERDEENWRMFFELGGIKPLVLTYEEFSESFVEDVERAVRFIGLDPSELTIEKPKKNKRLSDSTNEEWVEKYHGERERRAKEDSP